VQITRIYLRNYRVYEAELDLEIPAGLVGVFGPNGAGKSALLESILFTLFGRSRTRNDEIRTTGVNADCVTELEFQHEGHLYSVRRTISGINSTVKAEAFADRAQVANGVTDVRRYVHSILGMDDAAFRASVFAEQKQVAAFSDRTPAQRRDLVLKLLGITPLDIARDNARRDARTALADVERLRSLLPDVDALRLAVDHAQAAAEVAAAEAASEETAAATRLEAQRLADEALRQLDQVRAEHDALVREGRAVRAEVDQAAERVADRERELADLADADTALVAARADAEGLDEVEAELPLVQAVVRAGAARAALPDPEPGDAGDAGDEPPDEAEVDRRRAEAEDARSALGGVEGELRAAKAEAERARQQLDRSASLSADEACPVCGQALGEAFASVQAHRRDALDEATARVAALAGRQSALAAQAEAALAAVNGAVTAHRAAVAAFERRRQQAARRAAADEALAEAVRRLGRTATAEQLDQLETSLRRKRAAARRADELAGRLSRRPQAVAELEADRLRLAEAESRRTTLLDKVKALGFDGEVLAARQRSADDARARAEAAVARRDEARTAAARAAFLVEAERRRLADAEGQHAALATESETARHLGRLAELMNAFRSTVVASVGPLLSTQAAELFGELTDHEYERLEVDPETYDIRITDQGRTFGMDRFSGSETDLANLALRVAISEHVRFQSGGTVGLLVLDEVFGPLDDDRKERMLLALERLRARFGQVLVVTHASDIKEQLPSAIEVVKLPGRRATARVVGA
jgi:DNA repair exonuclease SbcCD ATPase subunit